METNTHSLPDSPDLRLRRGDALLLIDVQNDFLPGGSLEVPSGDEVIPVLNRYIEVFNKSFLPVYTSRDWHPPDHSSFRAQDGLWPSHCVAGSRGAEFSPKLNLPANTVIISKATNPDADAYSDFDEPDLEQSLRQNDISRLFIGGLATDYCVLYTVRDALSQGYEVYLLLDGIRAINLKPGDGQRAIEEMTARGAKPIRFEAISA